MEKVGPLIGRKNCQSCKSKKLVLANAICYAFLLFVLRIIKQQWDMMQNDSLECYSNL